MRGVDFIAIGEEEQNLLKFSEKGGILGGEGQGAPFFEIECRNSFLAICVTLSIVEFFFIHPGSVRIWDAKVVIF